MTAVHEDLILPEEFEAIARAVDREAEGARVELIEGHMGVKAVPDGIHGRIINWLLLLLLPLNPDLFLHVNGQGLEVGSCRRGRARPDGVLAPLDAFVVAGEWAPPDSVRMVVEVTSFDSDTTKRDRMDKPAAYAQSGIPIYLLIDRDTAEVVVYNEAAEGRYQKSTRYAFGSQVTLPEPVGITLDTAALKDWVA